MMLPRETRMGRNEDFIGWKGGRKWRFKAGGEEKKRIKSEAGGNANKKGTRRSVGRRDQRVRGNLNQSLFRRGSGGKRARFLPIALRRVP